MPQQRPNDVERQAMTLQQQLDITNFVKVKSNRPFANGSFGSVYHAVLHLHSGQTRNVCTFAPGQTTGTGLILRRVVVKVSHPPTSQHKLKVKQRIEREIVAWHKLGIQHPSRNKPPNVTELLGICYVSGIPGLVTLYYEHNDLLRYIEQSTSQLASIHSNLFKLRLAQDIACGLEHLHGNIIVQGDLKRDNVFISDSGQALIADFGLSSITKGFTGFTTVVQWNARFHAPELFQMDMNAYDMPRPTTQSDVLSLGLLMLQVFHGQLNGRIPYNDIPPHPHPESDNVNVIRKVNQGWRPKRKGYNWFPDSQWAIVEECLHHDPNSRPDARRVRGLLHASADGCR